MTLLRRIVAALLVSMVTLPPMYVLLVPEQLPAMPRLPPIADRAYRMAVVDWGYHTAIVIEQPAEWRLGPPDMEGSPFLEYAWVDRRFYLDSDFRPHALIATLFLPTKRCFTCRVAPRSRRPEAPR